MDADAREVVVGVDGSSPSREALGWAVSFARLLDAEVVAVHGVGLLDRVHGELVLSHPHLDDLRNVVEEEWCRPLHETGVPFRAEVVERPGVDALLDAAAGGPAALVVVGTRGRGLARDKALGSTALQLLRRATLPVLVVPETAGSPPEVRRIAVGFDGSPDARAALDWATRLAARTGAACEPVTAEAGAPAEDLAHLAAERGADLIVVGSSGEGAAGDPLEGSVSRMVAHEAGRPVVVVPQR
jgi:nucleotide-binding universal stress UspA family protein